MNDIERAEWLAGMIPAYGDYAKEAAIVLRRLAAALDEVQEEADLCHIQLAGCAVAAAQNTEESIKQRIGPDNPYYSDSYAAVCAAIDREMALRRENERLKALVGEMREDIMSWLKHSENTDAEAYRTPEEEHYSNALIFRADEALATDEPKERHDG